MPNDGSSNERRLPEEGYESLNEIPPGAPPLRESQPLVPMDWGRQPGSGIGLQNIVAITLSILALLPFVLALWPGELLPIEFFYCSGVSVLFSLFFGVWGKRVSGSAIGLDFAAIVLCILLAVGTLFVALAIMFGGFLHWLVSVLPSGAAGPGRLFRVRGRTRTAPASSGVAWVQAPTPTVMEIEAATRAQLAEAWRKDAALEHASIAAFSRLSLELMALGAPPQLLEKTHQAAQDEIRHATICFALASAYAGASVGPGLFPEALSSEPKRADFARMTGETLLDGCLGEGFAAAVAKEAGLLATDVVVREALAGIATDEARHAELAWSILAWCLAVGGEAAQQALTAGLSSLPRSTSFSNAEDSLSAHGRLSASRLTVLYVGTRAAVLSRAALLFAPTSLAA